MGFVAYMGATEINTISLMEIQGKLWEDNKTLFLNMRGLKLNPYPANVENKVSF